MKPLWEHQRLSVERSISLPHFAYFWEMGCGKSRALIESLRWRYNLNKRILRTIILCPPIVVPNWREEWLMYTKVDPRTIVPLYGSGKKRLETFRQNIAKGDGKIFITNYESLLMESLYESMVMWNPEVVVLDESHKCKSHESKRSKLACDLTNPLIPIVVGGKKLYKAAPRPFVYLLSGSPILNTPMDIFQQYKILDGGKSFGNNYFAFRGKYFRDKNERMPMGRHFPNWAPKTLAHDGFDAMKDINTKIYDVGTRVEKKDCLDLPPEVPVTINVTMAKEQARVYNEMKQDFIAFIEGKTCTAQLAIVKALRLMQVTSGFISPDSRGEEDDVPKVTFNDTPKRQALKELLEEITGQGHKVLVWAVWTENYKQIREVCQELNLRYVEVHGGISPAKKRENVQIFQQDEGVKVFLGHPGSGGIGINLTQAKYSIFYSRTFSLEHYLQARARNHRGGSKEAGHDSITHYDLVCENTIDALACKKLANKLAMSESLLKDISNELKQE